jgi:hypothetical protein
MQWWSLERLSNVSINEIRRVPSRSIKFSRIAVDVASLIGDYVEAETDEV